MPSFVVYYGETIRNVPLNGFSGPDWARRATARYYEEKEPRDYPVDSRLALHLITSLVDREFDPVSSDALPDGKGEGHAFAFVRKRLMEDPIVPVVPVFINTYFPPNQPTPRRCYKLGQAIREAVESYPGDARVGIVGSGGLQPFRRRRGARPRLARRLRPQGCRGAAILAAGEAQFRQLRDPHVDLRRRRRRASRLSPGRAMSRATAPRPAPAPASALPSGREVSKMSKQKDSDDLVRVGPGTVMGEMMRQYWIPAAMSSELERDGAPMRLMLLGEQLIAFRDSSGRVGVMDHRCPHRCASLFLGRNEENGIRCVYHGWKFDAAGNCVDMPNVPPHQDFKDKVKAKAYKVAERNGLDLGLYGRARRGAAAAGDRGVAVARGRAADRLRAARMQLAAGARRRHRHLAFRLSACRLGQRRTTCRRTI